MFFVGGESRACRAFVGQRQAGPWSQRGIRRVAGGASGSGELHWLMVPWEARLSKRGCGDASWMRRGFGRARVSAGQGSQVGLTDVEEHQVGGGGTAGHEALGGAAWVVRIRLGHEVVAEVAWLVRTTPGWEVVGVA